VVLGFLAFALQPLPAAEAAFRVYVTNCVDNTVVVFDTRTFSRVATFQLGNGSCPDRIVVSPDGSHVYVVTNDGAWQLSPPMRIEAQRPALSIAITPDGAYAYMSTLGSNTITVLATATNQIVATIPVAAGGQPTAIAMTPDGTFAYVTDTARDSVLVIDTALQREVTGPGYPIAVGRTPGAIAIANTPNGPRGYVTNLNSDNVSVIDITSNQVVDTVSVGTRPVDVAITPDGTGAYVTNQTDDSVSAIFTGSDQVVTTIALPGGSRPSGVAIDQDGVFVYVLNHDLNSMSVINTGSNQVVGDQIPVGNSPESVAIIPHTDLITGFRAVWHGSVSNLAGLLTTFTASVDDPSLVAFVTWDFYGDGTVVDTTSTTSAQFTYTRAGTFHPEVTVFLTDGSRASMTSTLRVQSAAEAIGTTISLVDWLELPTGETASLVSKLNAASAAVTLGDVPGACGPLQAFENEIHALVRSGRLDQASAAPRLGEADAIRVSLGCD
jgi:YVTN family beta-propeller protein